MGRIDNPLIWLRGEVKTPPFSQAARLEAGYLLRLLNFLTHGPCRLLEHDVMNYGSPMRAAHLVSYTEQMLMRSSFSMCLRRRLSRRLNRSLRPADTGFESMTE
jgi:hypothetical protein